MAEAFTQHVASRVSGLTRRQLDYLDEQDIIKPSVAESAGRGAPRLYSFTDLIKLKVAGGMRRLGRMPADMRLTIQALERRGFEDPFVTVKFYVTTDGHRIAWADPSSDTPMGAHRDEIGQMLETFDLPLRDLRTGLEESVSEIMARRPGQVAAVRSLHGSEPVIVGTRVPAAKIAALAAAGWSEARILGAFPNLVAEDVAAALAYRPPTKRKSA